MPKKIKELTKEEMDRAIDWLKERAPSGPVCACCQHQEWTISPHIASTPIHSRGIVLGGTTYPQVMLICDNCAHTMFFNAVVMGLVEHKEKEKKEEKKDG